MNLKPFHTRQFPAFINWLLCEAQLHEFPAKYRLYLVLRRYFTGRVIRHSIKGKAFYVPLEEWCFWLEKGPERYYPQDVEPFIQLINTLSGDVLVIDCGADIGTVSMMLAQGTQNITQFVCIEPNQKAFELLQANQAAISDKTYFINKAVSNFNGMADLHCNSTLTSDHEGHIEVNKDGDTEVITLDTLCESLGLLNVKNVVLKIDVEGQEQAVFEGAKQLIQNADCCAVLLEIHPDVLERDKQSAECIFSSAENVANFAWTLPAENNQAIDRNKAFFSQFVRKQYDVMGIAQNIRS